MKIGSQLNPAVTSQVAGERQGASSKTGGTAQAGAGGGSTTVQLSATATSLMDSSNADGSFDAAKVERIAQAIRDGKFEVNPEKIADKLISNAREVLSRYGS
ncbi:flagellar biosynthesis anti-sigma factor FlgM [Ideonella livida]|uniref:Negative regulator of flagellin synthesis n=1 Tax=Ideonella livida TaxID=2707176 RepID=A0A7C9TP31_9BURK|nr:flagellar biosynthesis anti-sigma factor FlgM [Ideonella livida]NDY94027.1 flagellar biosynthesis anti-sigma factor FlgM [Ideonella livida]